MLVVQVDIVAIYGSRASEAKKTEGIVLPGMAHSTTSLDLLTTLFFHGC